MKKILSILIILFVIIGCDNEQTPPKYYTVDYSIIITHEDLTIDTINISRQSEIYDYNSSNKSKIELDNTGDLNFYYWVDGSNFSVMSNDIITRNVIKFRIQSINISLNTK